MLLLAPFSSRSTAAPSALPSSCQLRPLFITVDAMADEFPGDWNAILQLAREARDDPQARQEKTRPSNTFRAKLKDAGLNLS